MVDNALHLHVDKFKLFRSERNNIGFRQKNVQASFWTKKQSYNLDQQYAL